jgi:hypothetical protein
MLSSVWWLVFTLLQPREEAPPPFEPKTSDGPVKRERLDGQRPPMRPITLPDEVIVRAMEPLRPLFVRCFKKAIDADPTVVSFKVRLHLDVNAIGFVTNAKADTDDEGLAACLSRLGRGVRFSVADQPAVVDFPLIYKG